MVVGSVHPNLFHAYFFLLCGFPLLFGCSFPLIILSFEEDGGFHVEEGTFGNSQAFLQGVASEPDNRQTRLPFEKIRTQEFSILTHKCSCLFFYFSSVSIFEDPSSVLLLSQDLIPKPGTAQQSVPFGGGGGEGGGVCVIGCLVYHLEPGNFRLVSYEYSFS